jgi:protein-tyrosine phosphatase
MITEQLVVGNAADMTQAPGSHMAILNVAAEITISPSGGWPYAWIPLKEFAEADPVQLDEAVAWLERHEKTYRLLIGCRAGMGRSVSVAIAYLCLAKAMPYQEAVAWFLRVGRGPCPCPIWKRQFVSSAGFEQSGWRHQILQRTRQPGSQNQGQAPDNATAS